jgi:DNA-binding response OmpR family regulator
VGKRVLLIEDEPNITEAIRFLLQREGWQVATHADGATAMSAVERETPDIVVLDVMLPNRSGFEILRELRDRPDTHALPVLMLTAKGQDKDRALAEDYGVSRFMTKPFSNQDILSTVRDMAAE